MAINAKWYKNTDEPNKLNKTLTSGSNISLTFKEPVDLTNPVFIISNLSLLNVTYNYVEVPLSSQDKRYYFITGVKSVANNVWEISCHVDVLMTYNTQIQALNGTLDRSSSNFDTYLSDPNIIRKEAYPLMQTKKFPNSIASSDYHFFLTTAGGV